ncbi:MAG: hypothetical protein M1817_005484 [Caeruleum heppii]|nr:MAG: hypothetical protein M1817_005484 [Caeruleum heppii]
MPYNNTAIPPPTEVSGQASLPLARVKRIIHVDEEVNNCSNSAAFLITVATEMFIQYFAEQGHNVVKSERKPRRNIQYKDLASAVSKVDHLEFLSDVVPKTIPYKLYMEKKAKDATNGGPADGVHSITNGVGPEHQLVNGEGFGTHRTEGVMIDNHRDSNRSIMTDVDGEQTRWARQSQTDHGGSDS